MSETLDLVTIVARAVGAMIQGLATLIGESVAATRKRVLEHPEVTGRATDAALDSIHADMPEVLD